MTATTSCGLCGLVQVTLDVPLWQPTTDDEWDTALSVCSTVHQIEAHLEDIEPEVAS